MESTAALVLDADTRDLTELYDEVTDLSPGPDPFGRHWLPLPCIKQIIGHGSDTRGLAATIYGHLIKNGAKMYGFDFAIKRLDLNFRYPSQINLAEAIRDVLFIRTTIIFNLSSIENSSLLQNVRNSFEKHSEKHYPKCIKHSNTTFLNFSFN